MVWWTKLVLVVLATGMPAAVWHSANPQNVDTSVGLMLGLL